MGFLKKISCFLLLSCFLSFYSCKTETSKQPNERYSYNLHSVPNSKCHYVFTNDIVTEMEIRGEGIETASSSTIGFILEPVKILDSGSLMKLTYDSIYIKMKDKNQTSEINAANGQTSLDPFERMIGTVKGNSVFIIFDKKGKVIRVEGYEDIIKKMLSYADFSNELDKKEVLSKVSQLFGENFVNHYFENTVNLFPDSLVFVGDAWCQAKNEIGSYKLNYSTQYTLESVKDSIARVEFHSEINDNNSLTSVQGREVKINLSGKEKGSLKVDLRTGGIRSQNSNFSIKGDVIVNGIKVPTRTRITKQLISTQL